MRNDLATSIHSWFTSVTAIMIFGLFIVPITLILSLKWFNPPISSFMLGYEISNNQNTMHYEWRDWDEIAESASLAVVAAEDHLFSERSSFNFKKLQHFLNQYPQDTKDSDVKNISRQTAKNLFLSHDQSYVSKGLETWLTLLMEASLDKQRILEIYLNIAEFGPGVYGIEAASQHFFYKPANKLTDSESALLAAVLTDPKLYHADSPSAVVEQLQRKIMDQMKTSGLSTSLQMLAGNS